MEYIIHGTTGRIDYEGREPEEDMEVERHYVGIYDPVTGDVEMYPAPRVLIRREIRCLREKNAELAKRNTATEVSTVYLFKKFFSTWFVSWDSTILLEQPLVGSLDQRSQRRLSRGGTLTRSMSMRWMPRLLPR